jgi:hypothetical protein
VKISIKHLKQLAEDTGQQQLIAFGWDGKQTNVATYGKTIEDCAQAAAGANKIKQGWGWPEDTITEPSRVKALQQQIKQLEQGQQLVIKLFEYLDMVEESDSGTTFRPNFISSCRAGDAAILSPLIQQLKQWSKT